MRIREVRIRSFRAIDELHLEFTGPGGGVLDLVVLAGPNGCGKTSVLEACLLALGKDALLPQRAGESRQDYSIALLLERDGQEVRISRTPGEHAVRVDGAPQEAASATDGVLADAKVFYFSSWRAPKLVGPVGLTTGAGRPSKQSPENALKRLKQHLINLQGLKGFGNSRHPGLDAETVFGRINEAWSHFYPELQGQFSAEAVEQGPDEPDEGVLFDLYLRDKKRPDGVPVDDLSSGEIETLTLVGTLVIEKTPWDIVFVDEPELHLHLAWHRAVLAALRQAAPETQFICATHSEEILDSVYSFERFTLLPEDDPRIRLADPGGRLTEVMG